MRVLHLNEFEESSTDVADCVRAGQLALNLIAGTERHEKIDKTRKRLARPSMVPG